MGVRNERERERRRERWKESGIWVSGENYFKFFELSFKFVLRCVVCYFLVI